ncbi:hypothetical protein KKG05_00500 [bacterium]|nr:hypothetical protein [bacterium]MBU1935851.1 hypothetical protein [bacterium]
MKHRIITFTIVIILITIVMTGQAIADMQLLYICGNPPNFPDTSRDSQQKPLVISNAEDTTLRVSFFNRNFTYAEGDSFYKVPPLHCFLYDMLILHYWGQEKGLSENQMHFLFGCGPPDWEPEWIDDYYNPLKKSARKRFFVRR